ncbi:hypothetical protein RHECNPAF_280058 [Rhizobium etli CNPAF512]|nr:hypothetical protein RHECNPAF_280058 [Rhizobium etli CNPAF512]
MPSKKSPAHAGPVSAAGGESFKRRPPYAGRR